MVVSFVEYLNGLRERANTAASVPDPVNPPSAPDPAGSPAPLAFPAPSAAQGDPAFSVALRDGEVLVLGLGGAPLVLSAPAAARLARRLFDAAALARGLHPGDGQR
jgi:hypothetical protein